MDNIIPIDDELKTFAEYLGNNSRCILSARFGNGKSFFLKEVRKKLADRYKFITIYPINYQVAENKDIFEYIKRDILLQILTLSEIDISDDKYSMPFRLWGFLNHSGTDIASDIMSLLTSSLLHISKDAINTLAKNVSRFKDYSNKINESQSDKIESYLTDFANQKGSVYEFDPISRIIYQLITDIKKHSNKQVVLIIEDMDRIDPAHIFRILNIFSAHWDIVDRSPQKLTDGDPYNKYNIDKILLVCHFQNIKNIFHHLYGEKTDFTGYIHKFSPENPYEYSLKDVMENWISKQIPLDKEIYPDICKQLTNLVIQKYCDDENIVTNIRHLTQSLNRKHFCIKEDYIEFGNENYIIRTTNNVTKLLCFLKDFGISIDEFLDSLTLASYDKDKIHHYQIQQLISECWLIFPHLNIGKNSINSELRFLWSDGRIVCKYNNYSIYIAINGSYIEDKTKWLLPKLLIENMNFANALEYKIGSNNIISTKSGYQAILSYFQRFVH